MAYLKLMLDEKEIAHLSEDRQYLCANEGVPQYRNRMDCKEILEMMGLPDYNAWEIVKHTNACLMEDPFWLRFSEAETFEDTTRGRARRIMAEYQKSADTN